MQRLSDHFAKAAEACSNLEQLGDLLAAVTGEMGFTHFALLDHASLCVNQAGLVRLDNYPLAWVHEIEANDYACDDPVHLASRSSNNGFGWDALKSMIRLSPRHKRILERALHFGIGNGFTVPANFPGVPTASCSFAMRRGGALPLGNLDCAELVGEHALRAARRLRRVQLRPQRPRLSRRELECLRLVALGKTDWEIAAILGLSIETAHQYVKRARAAYGSVSRTQLVVYALRDEWISFDEAIPPNG